jgi:hypothetical protein
VVVTLIALIVVPVGASTAASRPATSGGIGLRLLDVPVAAGNDPRAQIYIVDHLAPGAVIHRRIEVSNTTTSTAHIAVYAAAATIEDGSFLGAAGHTQNDLSTWTSVYPNQVDVAAKSSELALVSITVPTDAVAGEQYGVVWAEVRSEPVTGGGIVQVSRVGIRLYVSVGPGGAPAPDFTIDSLTATRSANGQPTVLATVHNTGGRALDMNGSLELLAGPGGLSAGPFAATLGTTLGIGDTEPITFALDDRIPAGPWDARITLASGLLERSARATITFPRIGASPPVNTETPRARWVSPVLAAFMALLLIAVVRRRRRHHGPVGRVRRRASAPSRI